MALWSSLVTKIKTIFFVLKNFGRVLDLAGALQ